MLPLLVCQTSVLWPWLAVQGHHPTAASISFPQGGPTRPSALRLPVTDTVRGSRRAESETVSTPAEPCVDDEDDEDDAPFVRSVGEGNSSGDVNAAVLCVCVCVLPSFFFGLFGARVGGSTRYCRTAFDISFTETHTVLHTGVSQLVGFACLL